MLNATTAIRLSQRGAREKEREKKEKERADYEKWLREEQEKLPEDLSQAEHEVRHASQEGRREVRINKSFLRDRDYTETFFRENLCEPHQELLRSLEQAGYVIELKYGWEPLDMRNSSEWYDIILRW